MNHPGAFRSQLLVHVARSPNRVAHVVQAVEHGDEIVARARKVGRATHLEVGMVAEAGGRSVLAGALDQRLVRVEAGDGRFRVSLRHQERGGSEPTADVGDRGADSKFALDAFERRQPGADQIGTVSGPEEALAADGHPLIVFVPPDTGAALESRLDALCRAEGGECQLEGPTHERGAALVGLGHGLLCREQVAVGGGVGFDEAARRLSVEPLADLAQGGLRPIR